MRAQVEVTQKKDSLFILFNRHHDFQGVALPSKQGRV